MCVCVCVCVCLHACEVEKVTNRCRNNRMLICFACIMCANTSVCKCVCRENIQGSGTYGVLYNKWFTNDLELYKQERIVTSWECTHGARAVITCCTDGTVGWPRHPETW